MPSLILGIRAESSALEPLRDRVVEGWLEPRFYVDFEVDAKADTYKRRWGARHGRPASGCASQQGNALLAVTRLGLVDDRAQRLAERLLHWQWPDGGWNCDKEPTADTSSFMETLPPMRGLAAYAAVSGDVEAGRAAERAAEVFLERRLFKRRSDGRVIIPEFTKLHYPLYWHYDVLGGLKARPNSAEAATRLRRCARRPRIKASARRRMACRSPLLQAVLDRCAGQRRRGLGWNQHAPDESVGHR